MNRVKEHMPLKQSLEQVPPYNEALEKTILCIMLHYRDAAKHAMKVCNIEEFYLPRHRILFDVLCVQLAHNGVCDEILAVKYLEERHVDDPGYFISDISGLITTAIVPSSIEEYCLNLKNLWRDREKRIFAGRALAGAEISELSERLATISKETIKETDLTQEVEDDISGKRKAISYINWPCLTSARSLQPGTLTLIGGSPGVSKSFFVIEAAWRMHLAGIKTSILELEKTPMFHLRRAVAQYAANSNIVDSEWCRNNPELARTVITQAWEFSNSFGIHVHGIPIGRKHDCKFLLNWLSVQANEGTRVAIIDPISIMEGQEKRYLDHENFVKASAEIASKSGMSIICVTHPRKGNGIVIEKPNLDNIPGSSSWERCCDTVLWLSWQKPTSEMFSGCMGMTSMVFNRVVHPLKVRLAANPGKIAYFMNGKNLCHTECGIIE